MIARIIKTLVFGAAAFYATRRATAHTKLLIVRAEAKSQMDELEAKGRMIFNREGEYADMDHDQAYRAFDSNMRELKRVTKIYTKTF